MTHRVAAYFFKLGRDPGRWRLLLFAVLLGAIAVLALPPVYIVPAIIVAATPAIWLLEGASARANLRAAIIRAIVVGWGFGVGFFAAGTYWIGEAFLVDAARTGWLTPFAVAGVAIGLAIFTAAAFGLTVALWKRFALNRPGRILVFAASWVLLEWVRSWIFTGFPWNLIGTVWASTLPMAQAAAWIGVFGLSLITMLAAAAPALLGDGASAARRWPLAIYFCIIVTLVLPASFAGAGQLRLGKDTAIPSTVPGVRLRIVQANIDQSLKWRSDLRLEHLRTHIDMSGWVPARGSPEPNAPAPTHVIWPEAAVPFYLANDSAAAAAAGRAAPDGGLLITGAIRLAEAQNQTDVYNTLHTISRSGEITATYDKVHLVPFGEYLPLRGILPFDKLVPGQGDLSSGPGLRTISVAGLPPFSPLICYEAIFPGAVTADGDRPQWLLNITNDAWFGSSAGPHQHFAAARLRAIEEGLPLVRAANTGISAIIDPFGRITARLGLGKAGVLDGGLPTALEPTLYSRLGNAGALGLALFVGGMGMVWRRRS